MSGVKQAVPLDELIRRSDAILLVEKGAPFHGKERFQVGGKAPKEMDAIGFRYKVDAIFQDKSKSIKRNATVLVFSSMLEFNLARAQFAEGGGPMPIPMVPTYAGGSVDPEKDARMVIFIRTMKGSRFCMTAENAFEKATWTLPKASSKDTVP
jgi:hypothetical protein